MRLLYLIIVFFTSIKSLHAQSVATVIYDANHMNRINENAAIRYSSENYHNTLIKHIGTNMDNIKINLNALVVVQGVIHKSLTQVDQALKSSKAVINIGKLIQEIYSEGTLIFQQAQNEPWLLLFAQQSSNDFKERSVKLALEVSDFILKEGSNVLMDYEKRDYLLRKITLELKVIRALMFSIHRSIYYAKINGIIRSINPYGSFINMDKLKAEEILRYYQLLK